MQIDGSDNRREHGEEYRVLARIRPGGKQIAPAVGDRPVAVFSGTVDAFERFFMQKAYEIVALRRLTQHLHHHHIVIDGEIKPFEHRRKLELRGGDLVVARLCRNTEFPQPFLDLGHELQHPRADGSEIVVFKLLVLRGSRAEHSPSGLKQIRPAPVERPVDQKVFLLRTQRNLNVGFRLAELLHQPLHGTRERLDRPQKRRFHVERRAGVCAERRRDAERRAVVVALDERGRRGVPGGVAARLEGRPEAARREGGCVGFAADEVAPRKTVNRRSRT